MLERLAAQVLNKYLGKYVENFNPDNLSIGIVQGAVELDGLLLRKDALAQLDLPGVEVRWGYIGKIILRIPSYKSYSEPWLIDVRKLYMIVGPAKHENTAFDKEADEQRRSNRKAKQLAALEEKWRASQSTSKSLYALWQAYSSSIVTNIVENLQVRLFDLHIRFEDDNSLPGHSFSCGILINEMSAQSTDENWVPKATNAPNAAKKWKKLHLSDMSFYWDTRSEMFSTRSHAETITLMEKKHADALAQHNNDLNNDEKAASTDQSTHQFILCPVSGEARFTRDCSRLPLRSKSNPRLSLELSLTSIPLCLTHLQYQQMFALVAEVARWDRRSRNRQDRPEDSILLNARSWWNWAISVHLKTIRIKRDRQTMEFLLERARLNVSYVKEYKQLLHSRYVAKTQNLELAASVQSSEKLLTFDEIRILRETVYKEIDNDLKQKQNSEKKREAKGRGARSTNKIKTEKSSGWKWGGWLGWGKKNTDHSYDMREIPEETEVTHKTRSDPVLSGNAPLQENVYKDLDEEELYEMFGEDLLHQDTNDTFLRRDSVLLKLKFCLQTGSFTLREGPRLGSDKRNAGADIVALQFSSVNLASEWRPRFGSREIKADLGEIMIRDLSPANKHFSDLMRPSSAAKHPSSPLASPLSTTPPAFAMKNIFSNIFVSGSAKNNKDYSEEMGSPVFRVIYEKLPHNHSGSFSNCLEITSAPLTFTVIPGLWKRLKTFFTSPSTCEEITSYGLEHEILRSAARIKYETWMKQTQGEIKRTVQRLMDGKSQNKANRHRWSVSLDIFAPEVVVPDDYKNPSSNIVLLNLGHVTFDNHRPGSKQRSGSKGSFPDEGSLGHSSARDTSDDSDGEDFITPPNTPPSEGDLEESSLQTDGSIQPVFHDGRSELPGGTNQDGFVEGQLGIQILKEKMYEQYHLNFSDLQVAVAEGPSIPELARSGSKNSYHVIERFSVDLLAEKRIVPTFDPAYPAVIITGSLPHLTLHVSHSKIHSVIKCLDQFQSGTSSSPSNKMTPPNQGQTSSTDLFGESFKSVNLERANSIQLSCDFLINQVSVVLEQDEDTGNQILSVLEVNRIQTQFVRKPFDISASFSIYSLLLVDVMQQLGQDFELLLASHHSVCMDVGSGNMLDSGTTSPLSSSQTAAANIGQMTSSVNMSRFSKEAMKSSIQTSSVLATVAEGLKNLTKAGNPLESANDEECFSTAEQITQNEHLISLEFKQLKSGSPELLPNKKKWEALGQPPCNIISAYFSNLDIVFNASSWITLLNFLHRLVPPSGNDLTRDKNELERNMSRGGQMKGLSAQTDLVVSQQQKQPQMHATVQFRQLNLLLLRHINLSDRLFGHKVATVTMHGTEIVVDVNSPDDEVVQSCEDLTVKLKVLGSVAGLQMQDLSTCPAGFKLEGFPFLSMGAVPGEDGRVIADPGVDGRDQTKAFSFDLKQGSLGSMTSGDHTRGRKASKILSEPTIKKLSNDDDDVTNTMSESCLAGSVFEIDGDGATAANTDFQTESRLSVQLASAWYIHSPRLVAEILALIDETGAELRAQMTTATRQAYKAMAKSIMDKVSDYSMAMMLGRSTTVDNSQEDDEDAFASSDQLDEKCKAEPPSQPISTARLNLHVQMQSPVIALPKYHGSFELLVADLGLITIQNEHEFASKSDPLDKLYVEVSDLNLRSHRQRAEELSTEGKSGGARISKLKQESLKFGRFHRSKETTNEPKDIQILHKTSLRFSVIKTPHVASRRDILDVRKCCSSEKECLRYGCCGVFTSCLAPLADKKMNVSVHAASALTVTLSKLAYEQVLKTLDNLVFGGDIDAVEESDSVKSSSSFIAESDETWRAPKHSASAPTLLDSIGRARRHDRYSTLSATSQSTPRSDREFSSFEARGFEIFPGQTQIPPSMGVHVQRRYTPISANFAVPCLIFQLNGDLSDGEQGIVKITLQDFTGSYNKEDKHGTALDLSLGSIDIEDLLQTETSPDRHIVVSYPTYGLDGYGVHGPLKTDYISTSCPVFVSASPTNTAHISTSLPTAGMQNLPSAAPASGRVAGVFRPYEPIALSSGAFGSPSSRPVRRSNRTSTCSVELPPEDPPTPPSSPSRLSPQSKRSKHGEISTLVHIKVFLVDGKSGAYKSVYDRVNRRVNIDFNTLDCKVNVQTWVVLLDFFGIGTSPKKTYRLDQATEQTFSLDKRLDVRSFYENQPDQHINSEIDFTVKRFSLVFNKLDYELLRADITSLGSHVQLRDATLRLSGQLGGLSLSDLSPNGAIYRERFIFTGDKALDFDIKKFDEYDHNLEREFDISVRIRMSSIRYVHTQRFQNETVAYCQHFQQLQEVLGRMRAASVGQNVRSTSCRQARVRLDIEADAPVILIPESSHAERLIVADLGHIKVHNEFLVDGRPGTLSHLNNKAKEQTTTPASQRHHCILDVMHVNLVDMDLFTGFMSKTEAPSESNDSRRLVFPSFVVTCGAKPMLKEKVELRLQVERNLEKEITHQGVPDTALCARLSSIYCSIDHQQYWLIRGVLDHNAGEAIPDFPQPTSFLQPSKLHTVLSGSVYTGLSMDFHLNNVSIELVEQHATDLTPARSLGRMDFVKSTLSYRAFSNNTKTTNLSCQSFQAHDTRWHGGGTWKTCKAPSLFTTILGPMTSKSSRYSADDDLLQFEVHQRSGPDFMEFTALLNNMRVYVILDWLLAMNQYLIKNPHQDRCDSLRSKTAQIMAQYGQIDSGNQRNLNKSGRLEPERRSNEIKMNVTETEFVVVQDASLYDTDAVILRLTAALQFCPDNDVTGPQHRHSGVLPLTCGLERVEVFSCQWDKENETALSIIDPLTVNLEIRPLKQIDLTSDELTSDLTLLDRNLLDIQVSELNMRVSYNDMMLFMTILKSLPTQAGDSAVSQSDNSRVKQAARIKAIYKPDEQSVDSLTELGYSRSDVVYALSVSNGDVTRAGSWLVTSATLQPNLEKTNLKLLVKRVPFNVARANVNVDLVRVCLIDDCAEDCDVPLAELALNGLQVRQGIAQNYQQSLRDALQGQTGSAIFNLSGDYYNRMLSLWEPFLEPWRCNISWAHETPRTAHSKGSWNLKVETSDRFDVTVTSTLIETTKKTASTWGNEYARLKETDGSKAASPRVKRARHPFVPYLIRNLTGCTLRFATQTTAVRKSEIASSLHRSSSIALNEVWMEVQPGEDHSFHFATRHEKQRHKRTDMLKLHQICVKVGEWETLEPVTVSRVGVYFRHAFAQISKSSKVYEYATPVRVVFAVTLEGSARKVVTVRSALAVKSRVKIPVQLQLESRTVDDISVMTLPVLDPGDTQYIPLGLTSYGMRVRPRHQRSGSYHYSEDAIRWQNCPENENETSQVVECLSADVERKRRSFFFSVCIQHKGYPSCEDVYEMLSQHGRIDQQADWDVSILSQLPGHTIIILPPVVISNLLPCDLRYYVKNTEIEGRLKAGQDATPHSVHVYPTRDVPSSSLILGCLLDSFNSCRELIVPSTTKNFQMRMVIKDFQDENLILNVRVLWRLNCSVKISVMAGYWIVNTTGLPIVVKQIGCQRIAAGQYDTHEEARSLQPLLFSYANRESPYLCTMRLGKKAQIEDFARASNTGQVRAIPAYCERFSTDGGSCTRNLKLVTNDGTPNREFYIGISVRRGWGRYLHTHIVTVAPRFLLINKTKSRSLSFAQRHAISYSSDASGSNRHLTIIPGSSVVYHWPRVDKETLLCVRLANQPACHWSGGFFIDRTDAFHIALRLPLHAQTLSGADFNPLAPHCIFLSVEVTLVNASYCVSLSDADPSQVPPPFRIDNVSPAPIIFKQVGTDEAYNIEVPAETQLAYACDEPCFPYNLQCHVKGASSQVTLDMNNIGSEKQLYYENFIYIALGLSPHQTFYAGHQDCSSILVLDVQGNHRNGYAITLQPLRSWKRSQLWRMTSDGRIFHEGSSPPDKNIHVQSGMVLDIAEMAISVGRSLDEGIPIALKPTDQRRRSTQTWTFTSDGRLSCQHKNLCVRAFDLSVGSPVALATFNPQRVPLPHELCSRHKMIPGSGVLSLKVVRDGPTRVMRIVDIRQKRAGIFAKESDWTLLEPDVQSTSVELAGRQMVSSYHRSSKFTLSVNMPKGVGISFVTNTPEELLYLTMNGINTELVLTPGEQVFSLRVQRFQVDNQLLDGKPPVMISARTTSSSNLPSSSTDPIISVHTVRQASSSRLYQIFKLFAVDIGRLSIQIEERHLWKILTFFGFGSTASFQDLEVLDEAKTDLNKVVCDMSSGSSNVATRFYFDKLDLAIAPLRLSVLTSSRLPPELKAVKRALTFSLVQFERAPVTVQAYRKHHLFETLAFIQADLSKFLRDQLKSQAAVILGSVDFLGNPIGLLTDVRAGMTGLAKGNLHNMVKHITHGLSNSAAKVTSTLSDKFGEIAMDEEYENKRRAIQENAKNPTGHVVAGLQGFMAGMIGGLTSVITQPVRGAQNDGARGFVKGLGKGIVGTITKPVTGVLDLASESASAVREISLSGDDVTRRARPVRSCHTFQGCLQSYSHSQAADQQFFYALNRNELSEHFYVLHKLPFHNHDNMLVLITSKKVYFVKDSEPDVDHIFLEVEYSNLISVRVLPVVDGGEHAGSSSTQTGKAILELMIKAEIFDSAVSFKPDSGDHFIVSYPKCGTTWMMNIMYLMKNGGAPLAKGDSMDNHIPFLEFVGGEVPAALTRPRTIKSHFYYDLIPKNSEAKYVFVARNPKDCLVSFYHHTVGFNEYYKYKEGTFDNFFEIFIEGRCDSGDYFKLVPEWYQQSLLHDNIHFVLYEDLKNDIQKEILRLADFLGPAWRPLLEDNDGKLLKDVIVNSGFKKMQEDSKIFPAPSAQYGYSSRLARRHAVKNPRVVCHSRSVADRVCQQINYAKTLASERAESLQCDPGEEEAQDRSFDLDV